MKTFAKSGLAIAVYLACTSLSVAQTNASNDDIEKIVVTGQKLANSVQDTKESVVVYTNQLLEARNLDALSDVFLLTPGVSGDQFGFRIRGVRNSDGASLPNRGDLASVVVDGVTLSGWVKSEAAGQLWDVSQVEVLRGPQSTNLGRNALAGAIVINTQDPTFENEGKVRIGFGDHGKSEVKGAANFVLEEGVSAVRVSLEQNESDGHVNNITRGEEDYGHRINDVYRVKWLYQPNDNLKSVLSYQKIESKYGNTSTFYGDLIGKNGEVIKATRADRVATANTEARFETDADLFSLNVDYFINDDWSLKSITAYQSGERVRLSDSDQAARAVGNGGGVVNRFSEDNNWSQEFRFDYVGETLRGSSGIYFSGIEAKRSQANPIDFNLPVLFDRFSQGLGTLLTTDAVLPVALYQPYFDTFQSGKTNVDTSIWAVFTEWEIALNDQWTLNAGIRYDNEEQDYLTASRTTTTYEMPAVGGPFGGIDLGVMTLDQTIALINSQLAGFVAEVPETKKSEDFSNVLPHAGVTYQWSDDVSSSFFVKKSYRSGGSELTLLNGVNNFDAEELWNYEASLRAVILEGKGVLNANVYYSDWTDQQVAVQEPGTTNSAFTMTVNAGESTLSGAEVNFSYELTDSLDIYTGFAISNTEYDAFTSPDGKQNFSGNDFRFAPKETAVIGVNYAHDTGFFVNVSANYTGSSFSNVANTTRMDSYTLVNVNGGYEFEAFKFEVYARNLTDRLYDIDNSFAPETQGNYKRYGTRLGAPKELGARITYSF